MWGAVVNSAAAIYGAYLQSQAMQAANAANIDAQDKANMMTVDLANTSHQREVADLRAANLNPILSAGGNGAAVPTLGSAKVQSSGESFGSSAQSVGREFARAMSTSTRLGNENMELVNEEQGMANRQAAQDLELSSAENAEQLKLQDLRNEALAQYLNPMTWVYENGKKIAVEKKDLKAKREAEFKEWMLDGIKNDLRKNNYDWFKSWIPFVNQGVNSANGALRGVQGARRMMRGRLW